MDFDTEAADDFQRAVKSWEDDLPYFRSRAGTDSWDCESDNGLLTPPPDCEDDVDRAWAFPPRPTYSDSWTRIMRKRVEDGSEIPIDRDSDTSSISSLSELYPDDFTAAYAHDHPVDSQGYRCRDEDVLALSGDFTLGGYDGYEGGSTATSSDAAHLRTRRNQPPIWQVFQQVLPKHRHHLNCGPADHYHGQAHWVCGQPSEGYGFFRDPKKGNFSDDDLLAEMIAAYTVPKYIKNAFARASSPQRKRSSSSLCKDKPSGISKLRSLRSSPRVSPRLSPRARSSKR